MAPTPENAPCWHVPVRPREICILPQPMFLSELSFSGASPRTVLLHSAQADAIPRTINSEYMSDPDFDSVKEEEDSGDSDKTSITSWAASSDGFSTDVSASRLP